MGFGWGEDEGETGLIRECQIMKGLVSRVKGLETPSYRQVRVAEGLCGKNDVLHPKFMKNYSGTI